MRHLEHTLTHKPSPRYRAVLFVRLLLCGFILGAAFIALVAFVPSSWRTLTLWVCGILGSCCAIIVAGYPFLSYYMWSYDLEDEQLVLARGWLYRYHIIIPMARVQYVDTVAGPLERALHLKTLKVRTAARAWTIPSLEPAVAEQLFASIAQKARVADDGGL